MKFTKFVLALFVLGFLLGSFVPPHQAAAQDTVLYAPSGSGDDYAVTVSFEKDSTQSTVTDWFPFSELQQKNLYYTHNFSNSDFGYSAGNDTVRCILQIKTEQNLIVNSDTIGTGNEGSEKIVSSGVTTQYTVSPKKFGKQARFVYENVVTGTHKNGWATEVGVLHAVPTHLK